MNINWKQELENLDKDLQKIEEFANDIQVWTNHWRAQISNICAGAYQDGYDEGREMGFEEAREIGTDEGQP